MNFLSHFYFDRNSPDNYFILGTVLPDLVKNAQYGNLFPQKFRERFQIDPLQSSILNGWERHLQVDSIFHSSDFFKEQTSIMRQSLLAKLTSSPVKPFFLAHIALELILDHLLTINGVVDTGQFYERISKTDKSVTDGFLKATLVEETDMFFKFFDSFVSSKYLYSYAKIENITYALNRICMRLWNEPFSEYELSYLKEELLVFKEHISINYMDIFNQMEFDLNIKGL